MGVWWRQSPGDSRTASSTFQTEDCEATHEARALEAGQAARWGSQKDLLRDSERSTAQRSGGGVRLRPLIDVSSVWVGREPLHFRVWERHGAGWRGA